MGIVDEPHRMIASYQQAAGIEAVTSPSPPINSQGSQKKQPGLKTARLGLTIVARCTSAFKLTMMRTEAAGDAHAQPTQQAFALQAWIAALPGQPRTTLTIPRRGGTLATAIIIGQAAGATLK